jgi:GrpB-like predicted nucleotidyltransferase (UPF0157 family)
MSGKAMNSDFEAYLERVLIGGREKGTITITNYCGVWPALFSREHATIQAALGETARRIEHIGSTSVPGLAAKPIIDVLLAVEDVEKEGSYVAQLEECGYLLRIREAGHRMLRTANQGVHIHVWRVGSRNVRRHLLFRDWLRRCPEDREAYVVLKQDLAKQDWPDRSYYAEAKGPLIAKILEHAEAWAATANWSE